MEEEEENAGRILPVQTLPSGPDPFPIYFGAVRDPGRFHVCLLDRSDALEKLEEEMSSFYSLAGSHATVSSGQLLQGGIYAFQPRPTKEGVWARVGVTDIREGREYLDLVAVDRGEVFLNVHLSRLRRLPHPSFLSLPAQAILARCAELLPQPEVEVDDDDNSLLRLHPMTNGEEGCSSSGISWRRPAKERFLQLVKPDTPSESLASYRGYLLDPTTRERVLSLQLLVDGVDVNEEMVSLGLATYDDWAHQDDDGASDAPQVSGPDQGRGGRERDGRQDVEESLLPEVAHAAGLDVPPPEVALSRHKRVRMVAPILYARVLQQRQEEARGARHGKAKMKKKTSLKAADRVMTNGGGGGEGAETKVVVLTPPPQPEGFNKSDPTGLSKMTAIVDQTTAGSAGQEEGGGGGGTNISALCDGEEASKANVGGSEPRTSSAAAGILDATRGPPASKLSPRAPPFHPIRVPDLIKLRPQPPPNPPGFPRQSHSKAALTPPAQGPPPLPVETFRPQPKISDGIKPPPPSSEHVVKPPPPSSACRKPPPPSPTRMIRPPSTGSSTAEAAALAGIVVSSASAPPPPPPPPPLSVNAGSGGSSGQESPLKEVLLVRAVKLAASDATVRTLHVLSYRGESYLTSKEISLLFPKWKKRDLVQKISSLKGKEFNKTLIDRENGEELFEAGLCESVPGFEDDRNNMVATVSLYRLADLPTMLESLRQGDEVLIRAAKELLLEEEEERL